MKQSCVIGILFLFVVGLNKLQSWVWDPIFFLPGRFIVPASQPTWIVYGTDAAPFNKYFGAHFTDFMELIGNNNGMVVNIVGSDDSLLGPVFRSPGLEADGLANTAPYGANTKKLVVYDNHQNWCWFGNEYNDEYNGMVRLGAMANNNIDSGTCNWFIDFGCETLRCDSHSWMRFCKCFQGLHGIAGFDSEIIGTCWGNYSWYEINSTDIEFLGLDFLVNLYSGVRYANSFANACWDVLGAGNYGNGLSPGYLVRTISAYYGGTALSVTTNVTVNVTFTSNAYMCMDPSGNLTIRWTYSNPYASDPVYNPFQESYGVQVTGPNNFDSWFYTASNETSVVVPNIQIYGNYHWDVWESYQENGGATLILPSTNILSTNFLIGPCTNYVTNYITNSVYTPECDFGSETLGQEYQDRMPTSYILWSSWYGSPEYD